MTGRPRLLLVSPAFHGYWRSIEQAWEALGYDVTTCCYDAYDTVGDKLRNKVVFELPGKLGLSHQQGRAGVAAQREHASQRARAAVEQVRPQFTVVIRGDILDAAFWQAVDRGGSKKLLWLYDELRRTRWDRDQLAATGATIASYSHQDAVQLAAQGFDAHYLPLAFDPDRPYLPVPSPDIVFVGARYPNREAALLTLAQQGVPVRAFGRDWSHHPLDRLRTWQWGRPKVPTGRDISLDEAYGRMAGAAATINIHGDQDGFTMRTFEASGVGGVQLVDRSEVEEFYDPELEVAVFTDLDQLVDLARRATTDTAWADRLRRAARRRTQAEHTFAHRMRQADAWWG